MEQPYGAARHRLSVRGDERYGACLGRSTMTGKECLGPVFVFHLVTEVELLYDLCHCQTRPIVAYRPSTFITAEPTLSGGMSSR